MTSIFKEYRFEQQNAVEIKEEQHQSVTLLGERVSFSAYGRVTNLQGMPIKKGSVLAKSGDLIEQAFLAEDGTFRVMGLQPGKTYSLTVESDLVERVLPRSKTIGIEVPSNENPEPDVFNIRFNSIEKSPNIDISGSVFFEEDETPAQLKTLYKEDPNVSISIYEKGRTAGPPLKYQALPISHYFEFSNMPRGREYEIVLRASRPMVDRRHVSEVTYAV